MSLAVDMSSSELSAATFVTCIVTGRESAAAAWWPPTDIGTIEVMPEQRRYRSWMRTSRFDVQVSLGLPKALLMYETPSIVTRLFT